MNTNNESPAALLPPIEHDEAYDRYYIPMPGGWEVQTKGKGSTFRIANSITGERFAIFEQPYLFEHLERMAREIHAASTVPGASESRGSVSDGWTTFVEQMDILYSDFAKYEKGDPKVPFIVVRDAVVAVLNVWAEHGFSAAPTPPAVANGEQPDWLGDALRQIESECMTLARAAHDKAEARTWKSIASIAKAALARSAAAKGGGSPPCAS